MEGEVNGLCSMHEREIRNAYKILVEKPERNWPHGRRECL